MKGAFVYLWDGDVVGRYIIPSALDTAFRQAAAAGFMSNTEVNHLCFSSTNANDIVRLQVTVDDVALMRM